MRGPRGPDPLPRGGLSPWVHFWPQGPVEEPQKPRNKRTAGVNFATAEPHMLILGPWANHTPTPVTTIP
eukprot:2148384-Pyramimonas_sp.AAC.1